VARGKQPQRIRETVHAVSEDQQSKTWRGIGRRIMPFCPLCKAEYSSGTKRCPDCEVDLVEELPEEADLEGAGGEEELPEDLVLLYSTRNKVYAEFLKETLENSNIPCYMTSSGSFLEQGLGYVAKGKAGYKIYVPRDKYDESLAIKEQTVTDL
jgi:hypothetical protein